MLTSAYLINLLPTPTLHKYSPYQLLFNHPPSYTHLRTVGCLCFPWTQPTSPNKFSPRSIPCVFIGYANNHKGYQCFDPASGHIYISRHVRFHEAIFPFKQSTSLPPSAPSTNSSYSPVTHPLTLAPILQSTPTSTTSTSPAYSPRNSTHTPTTEQSINSIHSSSSQSPSTQPNPPCHPMITRFQTDHLKPRLLFDLSHTIDTQPTPTSYTQAAKSPQWRQAMSDEFNALLSQATWSLVPPSPDHNVIGSKWTYKIKRHSDDTIARYKTRLVAQGFHQLPGIDYHETFSPVAKFPTIRTFLTLATHRHWPIQQLVVSNAFLHGPLTETVHLAQPPGFKDPQFPHHHCRLHKAIYGLKQSPRQWYTTFSLFL